jgi:REP element-mobilizing transposase RayT
MPRAARLDVLGVVQHVMARGIERRDIFNDAQDREAFLERLANVVTSGGAQLLGWSLLSNHFHLVLRPQKLCLKDLMRRLMTGYAGWYNRRHGRHGHLFQNRYRSIVVEEEPHLLELVRYVHLNPLRAGLVSDLAALDGYPYAGHAVLMGNRGYEAQVVDEVLERFGTGLARARLAYRDFVAAGVSQGESTRFRGGGLIRSAGGWQALKGRKLEERELADQRVLGSGAFVESLLEEGERRQAAPLTTKEAVLAEVATKHGVAASEIRGLSRQRAVVAARQEFYRRAYRETRSTMAELARYTGRTQPAVWQVLRRKS